MLFFNGDLFYIGSLLSLFSIALLYLFLKGRDKHYISSLRDVDHKFFYYKNLKNNKEYISKSFKKFLTLPAQENRFEKLISYFQEKDQKEVCKLYSDLSQDLVSETNYAKKVCLNKKASSQAVRILGFHHVSLRGKNKKLKGFFIFFADITEEMLHIYNLEYENTVIKKDLSNKNKILNTLPVPIWLRSTNLNVDYFNTKFSQIISANLECKQGAIEISKHEKKLALKAKSTSELQSEERYLIVNGQRRLYHFQRPLRNVDLVIFN